jgi:hypothetical protein
VPRNSGVPGLLKLLGSILAEIPRVKEIIIRSNGTVSYTWYMPSGAPPKTLDIQFDTLMPYAIIRNSPLQEVVSDGGNRTAVASLFNACHRDRLYPICLVVGSATILWKWLAEAVGSPVDPSDTCYGYPLLQDREVPDDVLLLCASYARTNNIEDTYRSYKITLEALPDGK